MKRVLFYITFAVIALIAFTACGARQRSLTAAEVQDILMKGEFRFQPDFVSGFLLERYYVYVSPSIVQGRLPSSTFTPPGDYRAGAFFTITDFESAVYYDDDTETWFIRIVQNIDGEEIAHLFEIQRNGATVFGREDFTGHFAPFLIPIRGRIGAWSQ